jgi:hypothetical protein
MGWPEALSVLGVDHTSDQTAVRRAFRARLRDTHPDLNAAADATERTVRLTTAYRVALDHLGADLDGSPPVGPAADTAAATPPEPDPEPVVVRLLDAETIGIDAPSPEVLPMLIEAAHQLGDITYLDPSAGLLEIVVEFVGAPTSSVVLSLQGRATGTTEVFCTVEPLSGGEAPPGEAVTHLLWRTLRGEDPTT